MTTPARRQQQQRQGAMDRPRVWARNPLAEFDDLLSQMGGLLESTVGGTAMPGLTTWAPAADVTEGDEAYHVELELPGVRRQEINIEVNGQELTVTGEIKERERKGVLRRSGRRTGRFEYRLLLPSEVNTEGVKAAMSDGVLTITVPKAETAKPRHIEITESIQGESRQQQQQQQERQRPQGGL
ncbi:MULTISPECIES: Hsp20/alpha crystallin family protein [Streptomyces]|uniref:Hsp20/alpha crystallin family protein n=3 Tax=Streptomyces TaxID=1883 RepID=A0ABX6W359_STRMQ|nr:MULTISPECIES: Hsp20/alpha crystallin family protein [Streptomyces]AQA11529.1 heat-shock protein [Streptomyces autolyticus]MCC4317959.1 Hsp20/alpha crystallin family protein [Streptomyces malaysiensis]MCD9590485.1 Hsp20/alpha crystallin family protein [Streptomyces sp. 8ZJF_21]MCQ6250250.1 Hsp20/alpha crystallin family protein [Streptomyces malaysiensis]QPI55937.1 Hsp20/alpha crystallin family protein [Streptomyces solisilvae]